MKNSVAPLRPNDLICITAPAKAIDASCVHFAKSFFEQQGYRVRISEHCLGRHDYFSGTDDERLSDFQQAIDDPEVKAIVCARGGYGAIQILDSIRWAAQLREPKWIVGFSDITVFHQRMQCSGIPSIHGTMPLNFETNTPEALQTLLAALEGKPITISAPHSSFNQPGIATGELVGGNLSILYSLLGTDDQVDYSGKLLFIEDLCEQLYHLDRMLYAFQKNGVFNRISGLIVGGMTDLKDTDPPTGFELHQLILDHLRYSNIPICFNFPAGHIADNRALVLGQVYHLEVNSSGTLLQSMGD